MADTRPEWVTIRFAEHRYPMTKNLPCPDCGKKVRRSITFTGTCNPFTTPPNMTYREMRQKLKPKMDEWMAEAVRCRKCTDALLEDGDG